MEHDLAISYEAMRSLVVEWLALGHGGQFNDLRLTLGAVAKKRGLIPQADAGGSFGHRRVFSVDDERLTDKDYARAKSIIWDLIIEGIIRPGLNDGQNDDLPFFHVTERGQQVLKDGQASPYDPDGFLSRLTNAVPNLDPIILTYLTEALHTFRINCLLSSTTALGCAAEKALLLLIAAYSDALPNGQQERFRRETDGRTIKRQFDEFCKRVESHLGGLLPGDVKENLDVAMNGVFTLLRVQRNETGHPTGKSVDREQAYANLMVFPTYVKKAYQLMGWLQSGSVFTRDEANRLP